ncbi:SDR family oxidoreductase, partial [Halomonas marinisediminis]
ILTSARPNPMSPYGFSKLSAELLAQEYSQCFGVNSISVRPFSLYGPGLKKQLLWDACNKFSKGIGEFFGTGEEVRDWLHVEDASSMIV